jgi:integrase
MRVGELCNINFQNNPGHRVLLNKFINEKVVEIIINTEKTCKKREIYIPKKSYDFFVNDNRRLTKGLIIGGFISLKKIFKFPFRFTTHVCRRTLATMMHESGVDVNTISMCLGNTPRVVMEHYILSSGRNYDACEIA